MAAIQTSDVTHSLDIRDKRAAGGGRYRVRATLSWISGLVYGTDHRIPVDKAKIGLPTVIESLDIMADGNVGYAYKYDPDLEDILLYVSTMKTGTSQDISFATTQNAVNLFGESGLNVGLLVVGTVDSLGNADSSTFRMPAMDELASGDTLTSCTLDIVAIGY